MTKPVEHIFNLIEDIKTEKLARQEQALSLSNDFELFIQECPESCRYDFNLLDYFGATETNISTILASLLAYRDHNGEMPILKSFIKTFMPAIDPADFEKAEVFTERCNIDILITGRKNCIIVENKIRNAVYQRNQIARYIKCVEEFGFRNNNTHIAIIPLFNSTGYVDEMRKSVWRAPADWRSPNGERACRWVDQYLCLCDDVNFKGSSTCIGCTDYVDAFKKRTIVIHHKFAHWLEGISQNLDFGKDTIVPATSVLLVDWLRKLYGINENQKLKKLMQEFLANKLFGEKEDNISEVEKLKIVSTQITEVTDLLNNLKKIQDGITKEMYATWKKSVYEYLSEKNMQNFYLQGSDNNFDSFGVQLNNGLRIGLWHSNNIQHPFFWGLWSDGEITQNLKDESKAIVNKCLDLRSKGKEGAWVDWDYTLSGSSRVISLIESAISLGFLRPNP